MYRFKTVLIPGKRPAVVTQIVRTLQSPSGGAPPGKKGLHTSKTIPATSTVAAEPFLNGNSSNYQEAMYESWLEDPSSVHKVRMCGYLFNPEVTTDQIMRWMIFVIF